jgi:hypothetical protein
MWTSRYRGIMLYDIIGHRREAGQWRVRVKFNIFMARLLGDTEYQVELQGRWILVIHVKVGHSRGGGYCQLGVHLGFGFDSVTDLDVQETQSIELWVVENPSPTPGGREG